MSAAVARSAANAAIAASTDAAPRPGPQRVILALQVGVEGVDHSLRGRPA